MISISLNIFHEHMFTCYTVLTGLLGLSVSNHWRLWLPLLRNCSPWPCRRQAVTSPMKTTKATDDGGADDEDVFITDFDIDVLRKLDTFYNSPLELCIIALPALISLALCPLTLYLYTPFTAVMWPKELFSKPPNINEALGCFLSPAGLIYALMFGFAFQQSIEKQHNVLIQMKNEISRIDQIASVTSQLYKTPAELTCRIYKALKMEAILMMVQIQNKPLLSYKHAPGEKCRGTSVKVCWNNKWARSS